MTNGVIRLFRHSTNQSARTIVYYAFDLLHLDGRDLTRLPLEERRAALTTVLSGTAIVNSESLLVTPAQIEDAVRRLQLEGGIAKRRQSLSTAPTQVTPVLDIALIRPQVRFPRVSRRVLREETAYSSIIA